MNIPSLPVEKLAQPDGSISPIWKQFFETLINQLQGSISNEGVVSPSQPSTNISLLTNSSSGTYIYDSTVNAPKVNVSGAWKTLLTATTSDILNHGVLVSDGNGGVNGILMGAGQVLVGTTSSDPVATTLTAGSNVSINSTSGSIVISASGFASFSWVNQTTSTTMVANKGYQANSASLITLTLPPIISSGQIFVIEGYGTGGWLIAQNAGQFINFGNVTTTVGTGGSIASTNVSDCITLVVNPDNTSLTVVSAVGGLDVI